MVHWAAVKKTADAGQLFWSRVSRVPLAQIA